VLVWLAKGQDLRKFGSGNIGATNAMRAAGKPIGVLSCVLDWGKGWLPVAVLAPRLASGTADVLDLQVYCGAAAVLGHCFPVYLGFRGGKGVATGTGALAGLDPVLLLIGFGVWVVVLFTTRYVGLASIALGFAFPVAAWWRSGPGEGPEILIGSSLLTLLILVRHRSNMARMLAGTEPKIGTKAGDEGGTA